MMWAASLGSRLQAGAASLKQLCASAFPDPTGAAASAACGLGSVSFGVGAFVAMAGTCVASVSCALSIVQVYSAQSFALATEHLAFVRPHSASAGSFALLASPSGGSSISSDDGFAPDAAALRFAKLPHAQQAMLLEMLLQLRRDDHEESLLRRANSPGFGLGALDCRVSLVEATLRHILVVEGSQQRRNLFVALARIHSRIAPREGDVEEDDGVGASSVVDVEPSFAFALSTPRPRVQAPPLTPVAAAASALSPSSPTAQSLMRLLALSRSPQQRQANVTRIIRPVTPLALHWPAPDVPLAQTARDAPVLASPALAASRFGLGEGVGSQQHLLVLRKAPLSPAYSLPAATGARADATPAFLAAVSAAAAAAPSRLGRVAQADAAQLALTAQVPVQPQPNRQPGMPPYAARTQTLHHVPVRVR